MQPGSAAAPPAYNDALGYGQPQNTYSQQPPQNTYGGVPLQNNYGVGVQNQYSNPGMGPQIGGPPQPVYNQYQPQQIAPSSQTEGTPAMNVISVQQPQANNIQPPPPGANKGCCGCENPCCGIYSVGVLCRICFWILAIIFIALALLIQHVQTCSYEADNQFSFYGGKTTASCRRDDIRFDYEDWDSYTTQEYSYFKPWDNEGAVEDTEATVSAFFGLVTTGLVFTIFTIIWDVIKQVTGLADGCEQYCCLQFGTVFVFIMLFSASASSYNGKCCLIIQQWVEQNDIADFHDVKHEVPGSPTLIILAWVFVMFNMVFMIWQCEHACFGKPADWGEKQGMCFR